MRPAAPRSSAMASSRCSTLTYSSLSARASSSARGQQLAEARGDVDLLRPRRRPGDLGNALQLVLAGAPCSGAQVGAGGLQNGGGEAVALLEQAEQQVLDVDALSCRPRGERLRLAQRLLRFFGEAIEIHMAPRRAADCRPADQDRRVDGKHEVGRRNGARHAGREIGAGDRSRSACYSSLRMARGSVPLGDVRQGVSTAMADTRRTGWETSCGSKQKGQRRCSTSRRATAS